MELSVGVLRRAMVVDLDLLLPVAAAAAAGWAPFSCSSSSRQGRRMDSSDSSSVGDTFEGRSTVGDMSRGEGREGIRCADETEGVSCLQR